MAARYGLFAKRFFLFLNIAAAMIFLLASLAPFLNPGRWWFISLLGLGVAPIFIVLFFFIFFWLIVKAQYALISVVALLIGWKSLSVIIAFNKRSDFSPAKKEHVFRIVHWNVARFTEW